MDKIFVYRWKHEFEDVAEKVLELCTSRTCNIPTALQTE